MSSEDPPAAVPYLVHINKNGGNTLRDILQRTYGDGLREYLLQGRRSRYADAAKTVDSPDRDVAELLADLARNLSTARCVAANLPYGIHRKLCRPVAYVAMLREPVDRCISYWYWAYRTRQYGSLWSAIESYDGDVATMLADGRILHFVNDQTRFITGSSRIFLDEDDLAYAKHVIAEEFRFVGAVERFGDSCRFLATALGWSSTPAHLNQGDRTDQALLPPHAAAAFRDFNDVDSKLHRWLMTDYLPRKLDR